LLVGLAALPDRSLYHKLFYALVGLPALIALLLKPGTLRVLLREPIILLFLAFSAWSLLSVTWSDTDSSVFDLLKRPLYIFMLFSACALLSLQASKRLEQTTLLGALLMLPLTVYSLSAFALAWTPGMRMIGSGALDNPLLSSHISVFLALFGSL
jgi:Tetracycline resistance determinant leader peptide.